MSGINPDFSVGVGVGGAGRGVLFGVGPIGSSTGSSSGPGTLLVTLVTNVGVGVGSCDVMVGSGVARTELNDVRLMLSIYPCAFLPFCPSPIEVRNRWVNSSILPVTMTK